jgi:biopolymer transport protein ExbB/TolQ
MKRGLGGLATIVSIAPWVGVFGTVLGLCNFRGFNGSNEDGLAYVALTVSEGIVPSAFGLLVGLMANWFYKFLTDKMEVFDSEMESATLQLVNDISRLC